MKNLTISTEAHLVETLASIPNPRDYFRGVRVQPGPVPDEILIFGRQRATHLGPASQSHHRFVLVCPLKTPGTMVVDDVAHRLVEKSALLVFPFQFHHFIEIEHNDVAWLFITFEIEVDTGLAALRDTPRRLSHCELVEIERMCRAYLAIRRRGDAARRELRFRLTLLLGMLLEARRFGSHRRPVNPRASLARGGADQGLLERVGRHVFTRLDQPLGVSELAHGIGMSESHLRAEFRRRYGMSPNRYLRRIKMLHAMRWLRGGSLLVTEIADRLGYGSLFAFSRTFKLETGLSPRAYRQLHARE